MNYKLNVAAVHPLIGNLQNATNAVTNATLTHAATERWLGDLTSRLNPVRWTRSIEAAVAEGSSTDELRLDYQELALTFVSALLQDSTQRKAIRSAQELHDNAVREIVAAHDGLDGNREEEWLKPYLRAAIVMDDFKSIQPVSPFDVDESLISRAQRILSTTFEAFSQNVPPLAGKMYTTNRVVPAKVLNGLTLSGLRTRSIKTIALEADDLLPLNLKLYNQLQKTEHSLRRAQEAQKTLSAQPRFDEQYHAAKLVDSICNIQHPGYYSYYPKSIEEQIKQRNLKRVELSRTYELVRLAFLAFYQDYEVLALLLAPAVLEALQFVKKTPHDEPRFGYSGRSKSQNYWRVMNNCLAADAVLREYGEHLRQFKQINLVQTAEHKEVVAKEFDSIAVHYRPHKSTEQVEHGAPSQQYKITL
jgi:hypothetical protein